MSFDEAFGAFKTHANYLRAFAHLSYSGFESRHRAYSTIVNRVLNSGILPSTRVTDVDRRQVRASLENAWGTELLLTLGEHIVRDEEVLRLSNNWNVVQAYYVIYHSTQAVAVSKRHQRPTTHRKTQQIYYEIFPRSRVCLPPWTLAFGYTGPFNIAEDVTIDDQLHSWTACSERTSWSLACKALRTTRDEAMPERIRKRRENKRAARRRAWQEEENARLRLGRRPRQIPRFRLPRLTEAEKEDVVKRLRPFGLIDYLYRLRLRSNYEDSAMFIDGPEDEGSSKQVRSDLCLLAGSTSLLCELYLMRLLGRATFVNWARRWLDRTTAPNLAAGLAERYELLEAIN
jgi:hypothetical protein